MMNAKPREHFWDRMEARIDALQNPTVLGLDPTWQDLPESVRKQALTQTDALLHFGRALIEATADIIPAIKLQIAFYEQYGPEGLAVLRQLADFARSKGMMVIVDAKRNDIGSTAEAYAAAFLEPEAPFACDAMTVNGYLGVDGIAPFLKRCQAHGKGVFVLVRTSNPSAGDLQDLRLADGRTVYEAMADHVADWGQELTGSRGFSSVGAVVSATWPEQAAQLRRRMTQTPFLIPGYGAQGGGAEAAVRGFTMEGRGGLVNASRSLMYAWKKQNLPEQEFAVATRKETLAMRASLRQAIQTK